MRDYTLVLFFKVFFQLTLLAELPSLSAPLFNTFMVTFVVECLKLYV